MLGALNLTVPSREPSRVLPRGVIVELGKALVLLGLLD
jgi:hypothetical protein